MLTGRRGVAILYAYMLLGLGFLRSVTPDFGDLGNREQELEGSFRSFFVFFFHFMQIIGAFGIFFNISCFVLLRFMHERLRTHAESVAFFGGGAREKAVTTFSLCNLYFSALVFGANLCPT